MNRRSFLQLSAGLTIGGLLPCSERLGNTNREDARIFATRWFGTLHTMRSNGTDLRLACCDEIYQKGMIAVAVSPDRQFFVARCQSLDAVPAVTLFRADGKSLRTFSQFLTMSDHSFFLHGVDFAPDGQSFLVWESVISRTSHLITICGLDGFPLHQFDMAAELRQISFSADGKQLFFVGAPAATAKTTPPWGLYSVDCDGCNTRLLSRGGWANFDVSPDGKTFVLSRATTDTFTWSQLQEDRLQLFLMDAHSFETSAFSPAGMDCRRACFSPSGSKLCYTRDLKPTESSNNDYDRHFIVASLDNSDTSIIHSGAADMHLLDW